MVISPGLVDGIMSICPEHTIEESTFVEGVHQYLGLLSASTESVHSSYRVSGKG